MTDDRGISPRSWGDLLRRRRLVLQRLVGRSPGRAAPKSEKAALWRRAGGVAAGWPADSRLTPLHGHLWGVPLRRDGRGGSGAPVVHGAPRLAAARLRVALLRAPHRSREEAKTAAGALRGRGSDREAAGHWGNGGPDLSVRSACHLSPR